LRLGSAKFSLFGSKSRLRGGKLCLGGAALSLGGEDFSHGGSVLSLGGQKLGLGGPTSSLGGPTFRHGGPTSGLHGPIFSLDSLIEEGRRASAGRGGPPCGTALPPTGACRRGARASASRAAGQAPRQPPDQPLKEGRHDHKDAGARPAGTGRPLTVVKEQQGHLCYIPRVRVFENQSAVGCVAPQPQCDEHRR